MRTTLLFLLIPLLSFAQKSEWQYLSDATNDRNNPLVLNVGNTDILVDEDFAVKTDTATIYNSEGKFIPLEKELYLVRVAFDYKLPDTSDFAKFRVFLNVGTGVPPVPVDEWRVSDRQGWVPEQETFIFWGGAVLAAEGGQLYYEVEQGTIEIANQNLTISRLNDQRPRPLLQIGNNNVSNGDIATTVVAPFTELFQEEQVNTRPDYFEVNLAGAEITIKKPGVFAYNFGISMAEVSGNTQRNTIAFWLEEGTATNTGNDDNPADNISHNFQANYMRDASGALEVSDGGTGKWIILTDADVPYTFRMSRDGVAGPSAGGPGGVQRLQGINNFFQLRKID